MNGETGVIDLLPEELVQLRGRRALRLVDVRPSFEHWLERIPGSELRTFGSFDPASLVDFGDDLVLYCRSGHRSAIAAASVSAAAGRPGRHLAGGILAWKSDGQPVERWGHGGAA